VEQAYLAAKHGANGYLVKGTDAGFWEKLDRLITTAGSNALPSPYSNLSAGAVSYLETRGLTEWDLQLLNLFYDGCPREKEIARITGRSGDGVRKHFQLIRDRLGAKSQGDLGKILGILACFREAYF
jgi:DNA-binding NarL/FixJ family response regulator